jgi:hypothetical protein
VGRDDAARTLLLSRDRRLWDTELNDEIMAETKHSVKYRVVGIHEDGKHVPLCTYLSLEAVEKIAALAQAEATFTRIIIESDDEPIRRARI